MTCGNWILPASDPCPINWPNALSNGGEEPNAKNLASPLKELDS